MWCLKLKKKKKREGKKKERKKMRKKKLKSKIRKKKNLFEHRWDILRCFLDSPQAFLPKIIINETK